MQQTKSRLKILKTCLQLQMQRHQAINSINVFLKNVFDFEKNRTSAKFLYRCTVDFVN